MMYEGETMSQIFKRTKKCCAKIFRKISFNTPTTSIPIRIRSHSSRYTLQTDRTQNNSPQNSWNHDCNWHLSDQQDESVTSKFPIKKTKNVIYNDDDDDNDHVFPNISPKLFTNRGTTSYVRVENCGSNKKNGTTSFLGSKVSSLNLTDTVLNKNHQIKSNRICGEYDKLSGLQDGDILFTDNKIYIGLSGIDKCSTDGNKSNSISNNKCNSHNTNNNNCKCKINDLITSRFNQKQFTDRLNDNDNRNETMTTTSFIVAQNFIEKFDSCLNLAAQNLRNSVSPRMRMSSATNNNYKNFKDNTSSSSCNKMNFSILKQDGNIECNQTTTISTREYSEIEYPTYEEVIFEKVKYDKNKRYLRHTPSNSSAGSATSSPKLIHNENLISIDENGRTIINYRTNDSFHDVDDVDDHSNFQLSKHIKNYSLFLNNSNNNNWNMKCNDDDDFNGNENELKIITPKHSLMLDDICNSDRDSREYHQNCNNNNNNNNHSLRQKYSIPWDDLENSYNNENDISNKRNFYEDPWDVFDNKMNKAKDKKLLLLRRDDFIIRGGSPRSSSTTLETWLDDETVDNSFNEELEKRYVPFER